MMKPWQMLLAMFCGSVVLSVAGCGDDNAAGQNSTRFVDQDRLDNPIVDTKAVDEAVQTEAMTHMNLISRQVNLTVAKGADKAVLYRAISGTLNASKLSKIGLSESLLKGNYYKASDYSVVIVGNQMTISAAQLGTRGRVEPQKFRVP